MKSQKGFSLLPVLLFAVILGLVGIIGWRVFDAQRGITPSSQSEVKPLTSQSEIKPITTKAEAEKVQVTLDSANLDTDLDSSSLDADLDSLL